MSNLLTLRSCSLGLQRSFCNSSWKQSPCQALNQVLVLKISLWVGVDLLPALSMFLYVTNTGHVLYALNMLNSDVCSDST